MLLKMHICNGSQLITFWHSGSIKVTELSENSILVFTGSQKSFVRSKDQDKNPTALM